MNRNVERLPHGDRVARDGSKLGFWMLKLGISHPIAPVTNPISSAYVSTALNCGNWRFTLSGLPRRSLTQAGARKSKPTCALVRAPRLDPWRFPLRERLR